MIQGILGEICKFNDEGNKYLSMNADLKDITVYVTKSFYSKGEKFVDVIPTDLNLKRKYGTINRSFRLECFDYLDMTDNIKYRGKKV